MVCLVHKKTLPQLRFREGDSCWQFLSCNKVLCPSHGNPAVDCWLITQTHRRNETPEDHFESLGFCLSCKYFLKIGSLHPKGLSSFIAEQLREFNSRMSRKLLQKKTTSCVEILNKIHDGVFTFDQDWRINSFNPPASEITGVRPEDAIGKLCKDVFILAGSDTYEDFRKSINDGLEIHDRNCEIISTDGEKKHVFCTITAFRSDKGDFIGGAHIFKDISELTELKEEVVRRAEEYNRIFEGGHDMIYVSRQNGELLNVNAAGVEMLGFSSKEEMLALDSVSQFYANPSDRDKLIALLNRNGTVKDLDFNWKRTDGKIIHVLLSSRSYKDSKTDKIQYEGIVKDITRRKEIESLVQKRNRELSILNGIAFAVNYTMQLDNILQITLGRILNELKLSQGGIFLIDRTDKTTKLGAVVGLPSVQKGEAVELTFKDLLLRDFLIERASKLTLEASFPYFQVSYNINGNSSPLWLSCHLIMSKGKSIGFFGFALPPSKSLDHHDIRLLGSLGNFLGNAIENVKMIETISQNRHDLQRLTEKLFQTQEDDRRRLARELHDEAGQSLTAVKLGLDHLEQNISQENIVVRDILTDTRKMLVRTSSEIRRLAYHLHPTLLTDLGLEPALKLYFKDIETHSCLNIEFQMIGFSRRLEKDLETSLYRFSQEAMTNTLKHSGAELFKLKIIKSFPKLIFIAEDDGIGFDEKVVCEDKRSLGLLGMRERAQLIGGTFNVRGRPGQGARIRIEIKMPADYETFTQGL
jgi:PAS domain S-box-containing protein